MQRHEFIALIGGAAIVWPLAATARQPMPVIGHLGATSRNKDKRISDSLREALKRTKVFILAAAGLPLMSSFASSAPQQIRNKTITASWSVESTLVAPNGRIFTPTVRQQRVIYVGSTGRTFVKATVNSPRGDHSAELAPGEKTSDGGARDVRIEGSKIVAMAALKGGAAGRMIISFDQSYSTCTVDLVIGRSGRGPAMTRGQNGVPLEVRSHSISGQSCSVREGNAFANR